jgi:hypothetical protein
MRFSKQDIWMLKRVNQFFLRYKVNLLPTFVHRKNLSDIMISKSDAKWRLWILKGVTTVVDA